MGTSLDKNDILILRESHPNYIIDILSQEELTALDKIRYMESDDIEKINMSFEKILLSVRQKVFENIDLPTNYPPSLIPMCGIFDGYSSEIGIIVDDDKVTSVDMIKEWVINKLANQKDITKVSVSSILEFDSDT
jgi:hypothetical protein